MPELILFNKPYRVLCQFSPEVGRACLKDYIDAPGFYPAGRLDFDSEGLLLLTNNGQLQAHICQPRHQVWKRYVVQVDGAITPAAIEALKTGLVLKDGPTRPARVEQIDPPQWLWPRVPPVRFRKEIPTSWLTIEIHEGRNRQIRRMCAAVMFPTLRLVRMSIGPWELGSLSQGQWMKIDVPLQERLNKGNGRTSIR